MLRISASYRIPSTALDAPGFKKVHLNSRAATSRTRRRYDISSPPAYFPRLLFQTRYGGICYAVGGRRRIAPFANKRAGYTRLHSPACGSPVNWRYTTQVPAARQEKMPTSAHIVVHYHELWLKLGNRLFFL